MSFPVVFSLSYRQSIDKFALQCYAASRSPFLSPRAPSSHRNFLRNPPHSDLATTQVNIRLSRSRILRIMEAEGIVSRMEESNDDAMVRLFLENRRISDLTTPPFIGGYWPELRPMQIMLSISCASEAQKDELSEDQRRLREWRERREVVRAQALIRQLTSIEYVSLSLVVPGYQNLTGLLRSIGSASNCEIHLR